MIRKITWVLLLSISLPVTALFADRQAGVLRQFRAAEESIRARGKTMEDRKNTLENNLSRGLKEAILRMFYEDRDKWLKDLSPRNFSYENPTSPQVYYVRYKNLIIRFDFATDPEVFYQAPILRKVLVMDEASAHAADDAMKTGGGGTAATPASGNSSNPPQ